MSGERQNEGEAERSADRIYARLVEAILAGVLKPGERLDEQRLAERHGVSRTPVREALQALALTGLAERGKRRSFVVSPLEPEALGELFEAMGEIEALAARLAAKRMTAVERQELAELVAEGDQLAAAGDADAYGRLNIRFHQLIFEGAHNRFIAETAQNLRVRTGPHRQAQFTRSDRMASSQAEHRALLEAIQREDSKAAAAAMTRHITSSSRTVLRLLQRR
ncbi:GntR family transcriptional regulator [Limibacillus halophilus]